jgi:hypothetical protein
MSSRILGLSILAAILAACSPAEYAFVPVAGAVSATRGGEVTTYPIPPGAPQGDLKIASNGIAQLSPQGSEDETVSALHLRLVISNASDGLWTMDTREQRVEIAGRGSSSPAFASASPAQGAGPPAVIIAPKSERTVDLFFPLPADMQDAGDVPGFSVLWKVDTSGGAVTQRTPFDRVAVEETADYGAYGYGYDYAYWGEPYPPYWYNPVYVGFYGGVFPRPIYVGHPIIIRGWRGHYYGGAGYPAYRGGYHGGYRGGYQGGGFHGGSHAGHGGHR